MANAGEQQQQSDAGRQQQALSIARSPVHCDSRRSLLLPPLARCGVQLAGSCGPIALPRVPWQLPWPGLGAGAAARCTPGVGGLPTPLHLPLTEVKQACMVASGGLAAAGALQDGQGCSRPGEEPG